ncbi:MAG: hypothetical protein U1E87_01865 [Alphaproteobacteria bacterium]
MRDQKLMAPLLLLSTSVIPDAMQHAMLLQIRDPRLTMRSVSARHRFALQRARDDETLFMTPLQLALTFRAQSSRPRSCARFL